METDLRLQVRSHVGSDLVDASTAESGIDQLQTGPGIFSKLFHASGGAKLSQVMRQSVDLILQRRTGEGDDGRGARAEMEQNRKEFHEVVELISRLDGDEA